MKQMPRRSPKVGANPNRTHFNAGTVKSSSHASYSQQLRHWFYNTQRVYATQEAFAAALGLSVDTLRPYFTGKTFPSDPVCDRLYSLTQLPCFSPEGRVAARAEHLGKKGLSTAAILKQRRLRYARPEQLTECIADIRKAKTMFAPSGIVCLGRRNDPCGCVLKALRAKGSGAHLRLKHGYSNDLEYKNEWGYSHGTALVSQALSAFRRDHAEKGGYLRPDAGKGHLHSSKKGRVMSGEFRLKTADRMRGQRNPDWGKNIADVEFVWAWLMDGKDLEEVAQAIAKLSPDGKFTLGGVHGRLKAIVGTPVRRALVADQESAERAVTLVHDCASDDAKLRAGLIGLCEESRKEVAAKQDRKARRTMLWIPIVHAWLQKSPSSANLSLDGLTSKFLQTEYLRTKPSAYKKPGPRPGPRKKTVLLNEMAAISELQGQRQKEVAAELFPAAADPFNATYDYFSHHRVDIVSCKTALGGRAPEELAALYQQDRQELAELVSKKNPSRTRRNQF